jgi:hypothetical protein
MATHDHFAQLCRRVCEERGWDLTPSGVQVNLADGRKQIVELEHFEFQQDELVRLFTTIGSVDELGQVRLTVALRVNAELAHGALAVKGEYLVMTDTVMLRDANFGQLEAAISYLAETADHYEKTLYKTDQF